MPVGQRVKDNASKITAAIAWAAEKKAEILLTPEGSLSGYAHEIDPCAVGKALEEVTEQARVKGVGLALGTCFLEKDGKCYNQIRFYRPDGEYLGFHSKTLCCGSVDGRSTGELNHFSVSPLRVFPWREGVCIGGLVCNDLWANPGCTPMPDTHLSQQLSAMGADVIFHAINGGRNGSLLSELVWKYHESKLRMRARAGQVWIVTADNPSPEDLPCSAPSGVIDRSGEFVKRAGPQGEARFVQTITLASRED